MTRVRPTTRKMTLVEDEVVGDEADIEEFEDSEADLSEEAEAAYEASIKDVDDGAEAPEDPSDTETPPRRRGTSNGTEGQPLRVPPRHHH